MSLTSSNSIKDPGFVNSKIERLIGEEVYARSNFQKYQKLTEREIEVLTLIAKGLTNISISERLFISIETVKSYRKILKKKTECRNTVELVIFAQAFDLI